MFRNLKRDPTLEHHPHVEAARIGFRVGFGGNLSVHEGMTIIRKPREQYHNLLKPNISGPKPKTQNPKLPKTNLLLKGSSAEGL